MVLVHLYLSLLIHPNSNFDNAEKKIQISRISIQNKKKKPFLIVFILSYQHEGSVAVAVMRIQIQYIPNSWGYNRDWFGFD